MARESHDASVDLPDDGMPSLRVTLAAEPSDLAARLAAPNGGQLPARDVDVTYREREGDQAGVLALANRLTGEFILEVPLARDRVRAIVEAVGERSDGEYRLELVDGERRVTFGMDALLVYDTEGTLLTGQSLLPGGVEL